MIKLKLTIIFAFLALICVCVGSYVVLNASVSPFERCKILLEEAAAAERKQDRAAAMKCYAGAIEQAKAAHNYQLIFKASRNLASIDITNDKIEDAVAILQKALADEKTNTGTNSTDLDAVHTMGQKALTLCDLCSSLEKLKRYADADKACMQAIAIASEAHGPGDMTENLMIDHERLLQEMGRTSEANQAAIERNATYHDFRECYQAGVDDYDNKKFEDALNNLTAACAIARRTGAGSRFSALTYLALVQLSLGQTKQAASSLLEAEPLYREDVWKDERTRYMVAQAFSAAANNNDQLAEKFIAKAFELKVRAAKDVSQGCVWACDTRPQPKNVSHALALISLASGKYISSDPSGFCALTLPAAHVNLISGSASDFKTLVAASLKAGRATTRQKYVNWLVESHDKNCLNGDILLSTADSLQLVEPENVDRDVCQQILIWQGRIALDQHQFRIADQYFQRALSIIKKNPMSSPYETKNYISASLDGLANVALMQERIPEAETLMREALNGADISNKGTLNEFYIWRACALADILIRQGKYKEARKYTTDTIAALSPFRSAKGFKLRMDGELGRRLAEAELREGDIKGSIEGFSIALLNFQKPVDGKIDNISAAICETYLADSYAQLGKVEQAKECWQKALDYTGPVTADSVLAFMDRSLWYSHFLLKQKDFAGAEKIVNAALLQADKFKAQARPLNLGFLYDDLSEAQIQRDQLAEFEVSINKSRDFFRQSIADQRSQNKTGAAVAQDAMSSIEAEAATIYRDRKLWDKANLWWQRSVADSTTSTPQQADAYLNRTLWYAQTLKSQKKLAQAREITMQALKSAQNLHSQNHDRVVAFLYWLNGDIDREERSQPASSAHLSWKEHCKQNYLKARQLFLRVGDQQAASACENAAKAIDSA